MESIGWEYCRKTCGRECTEEILDFANMVFGMEYGRTDFASLLPKAYAPERCGIPVHHMIMEENRLRALIDVYPLTLRLKGKSGCTVSAAYVGTVSVHPNARGRGYMIELMKRVEEDARSQGCALLILDGDRHRYQHYGYEHEGIRYRFQIGTGNIRHCCAAIYSDSDMASPAYSFEELDRQSPYLDMLYALYQNRLVTARPREDFWYCLQSYQASAYAILRDGRPVGYMSISSEEKNVTEIEMEDVQELPRVLYDLMTGFDTEQLCVSVGMDETDKAGQLEKACGYCDLSMSHQIRILDYESVLSFLLEWKRQYGSPAAGEYVLGVQNAETGSVEKYLLSVAEEISVSRTDQAADTVLGELDLVRILTTSFCFAEQQKGARSKIRNAPAGWFPLPFYLPEADTF